MTPRTSSISRVPQPRPAHSMRAAKQQKGDLIIIQNEAAIAGSHRSLLARGVHRHQRRSSRTVSKAVNLLPLTRKARSTEGVTPRKRPRTPVSRHSCGKARRAGRIVVSRQRMRRRATRRRSMQRLQGTHRCCYGCGAQALRRGQQLQLLPLHVVLDGVQREADHPRRRAAQAARHRHREPRRNAGVHQLVPRLLVEPEVDAKEQALTHQVDVAAQPQRAQARLLVDLLPSVPRALEPLRFVQLELHLHQLKRRAQQRDARRNQRAGDEPLRCGSWRRSRVGRRPGVRQAAQLPRCGPRAEAQRVEHRHREHRRGDPPVKAPCAVCCGYAAHDRRNAAAAVASLQPRLDRVERETQHAARHAGSSTRDGFI